MSEPHFGSEYQLLITQLHYLTVLTVSDVAINTFLINEVLHAFVWTLLDIFSTVQFLMISRPARETESISWSNEKHL